MWCFVLFSYIQICLLFFFFNDTATTEIYTLSLHDALPIFDMLLQQYPLNKHQKQVHLQNDFYLNGLIFHLYKDNLDLDRKSTRLNSSHANISYAVFCLKKKKKNKKLAFHQYKNSVHLHYS